MSTKSSISHDDNHHLYKECFEDNLIYLQLDNPVSLTLDYWEGSNTSVTVAITTDLFSKIVDAYRKIKENEE